MPLVRYFFYVGGVLLALLFLVDAYLPQLPATRRADAAVDLSVIRIHSDRKWPERIVFDTTLPTITPPANAIAKLQVQEPTGAADVPAKVRVREALAQLPSNPSQVQPADSRKSEPKRKRKFVARAYVDPPSIRVAQQPRLGFFGNNIW